MRTAIRPSAVLSAAITLALVAGARSQAQSRPGEPPVASRPPIQDYFRRLTTQLADDSLADIKTLDDWQNARNVLRGQLMDMLGLSPAPERTELRATITGTIEHDDFVVEKLHFQSRPGLYVTANFYRPKKIDKPLPTILYLCGHGNVKIDGISYGAKASYQHHPAWFAREGYCCLILDTLQLAEIEGLHHGTYREGMWWWLARGYTPAGVEAWNAVRALDYLETRPEVDMKRIGVTGRSGGGAYTWWLAAIDDRPACLVPVAGITDLENHVVDGCIEGHCDCMFMVNTYGWDFATVAALAAPRPLLFSNSDKDTIFPLTGVVRTHAKLKRIYDLYKASDKLGLLITEGPHKDTQELQIPAFRWMNRWLQSKDEPITRVADKPFDPKQLKVFAEIPSDQKNTVVQEWFVAQATAAEPPATLDEWERRRGDWLADLQAKCFRGWPSSPLPLDVVRSQSRESHGLTLDIYEYTSDRDQRLPVYVLHGSDHAKPSLLVVTVMDESGWDEWLGSMAPAFSEILPQGTRRPNQAAFDETAAMLKKFDWAFAMVPPRGIGPTRFTSDAKKLTHIERRFELLGETADSGRVWDLRRASTVLSELPHLKDAHLWYQGAGTSAGIALYASLFEPRVERVDLHQPATSHRDGPYFLNVLRTLDMPQAVALAFPKRVIIYDSDESAWEWSARVSQLYGSDKPPLQFRKTPSK